jgi:iron complex transport system substrate-binding protein
MWRRALGLFLMLAAPAAAQESPARVVSMNLCTDQMAMLLAAPGQLLSVSSLARDAQSSAMAEQAKAYPINHGLAEEIWLLKPDLVIAGTFTSRASVDMLKRLGVQVLTVPPAYSLADVTDRLRLIGEALGRSATANAVIGDFEARLSTLRARTGRRPSAALYYANGYTTGNQTLAGEILLTAGFSNIAGDGGGGRMSLEELAMAQPEALITGQPYPGASRSEEILDHPVVRQIRAAQASRSVTDSDWLCGTPFVLQAIEQLSRLRQDIE